MMEPRKHSRAFFPVDLVKNSRGLALFMSIALMTVFLFFLSASLYLTRVDTKITSNLKLATQALEVADAGLHHALAAIPDGYDFDAQLSCTNPPGPPCLVVSNAAFPTGSSFGYTVTAENDPIDAGGATDDTDERILLVSSASHPTGAEKKIEAYVRRSMMPFSASAAVYINADSAVSYDSLFFDADDGLWIDGYDTDPEVLKNRGDDTAGPEAATPKYAIATTNAALTGVLQAEWDANNYENYHYFCGQGADCIAGTPSLGTTTQMIDINQVADKFIHLGSTVKYESGLITDDSCSSPCQPCPSSTPCMLGTSASPQVTYINDPVGTSSVLRGHVEGHGVLVVEGRTTIGDNFRFNGLVIHKRTDSTHYISLENSASIYGNVFIGALNGQAKFTIEDFVKLAYSSQALAMVESNWGPIIPSPARILAWQDK